MTKDKHYVLMTEEATKDLIDLYRYVAYHDSSQKASRLIDKLEKVCESLDLFPQRGHCPPELQYLSIHDFLEIHFKPYRIIYRIMKDKVYIYAVLDGRRDMQSLLECRLLR